MIYLWVVMRGKIQKIVNKAVQIIGSKYFFWFIIALFIFQAMWIAFSFRYPMIYDEYYHFGLIEYFSHQWLPWIKDQPNSLDQYGSLARNPFLFYHYLMSFPFRIISLFTNNLAMQVISMRIVNIGLFAGGLVIFAKLFKSMKIQPVFRNIALLFFVLLPATPFVAATVNYDNAIFLLTALFMFVGLKIIQNEKMQWYNYVLLVLIGMAGSLMKTSFLPIFAAGFAYIFIRLIIKQKNNIIRDAIKSFKPSSIWLKVVILVPFVIVGFIFAERFAVNIVKYHSLSPSCERLMTKERCLANIIELRADDLKKNRKGIPDQDPQYVLRWSSDMIFTLLWTGSSLDKTDQVEFINPLPVIYTVVFIGSIISLAAITYSFEKFKKIPGFWFVIVIIACYIISLFYVNISAYYEFYQPVSIQGRYLLPLLPVIMLFALLGINNIFHRIRFIKVPLLLIVFVLILSGAGVITHIVRSRNSWYWDNSTVRQINVSARNTLSPLVQQWWYDRE